MPLHLRYVSHSEIGLIRKNNQDSGYVSPRMLVVADGMGGAAAGDLASAVAIDALRRVDTASSGEEMLVRLSGAIHRANDRIADLVEADHGLEGMGTTLTGVLFDGTVLGLAHIGDSRAYLLRDGQLRRLTHDHSWVQSLIDEGRISEEEAASHPHRSLLIKVLNGHPTAEPDLALVDVQVGDRVLLCSDGVCGLIDDEQIAAALRRPALVDALGDLVEGAHAGGGIDNITAIVADVVEEEGTTGTTVFGAAAERDLPAILSKVRGATAEDTVIAERPTAEAQHDDEARYSPQLPQHRRLRRSLVVLTLVTVVLASGLGAAWAWTRTQYYVGAVDDQVAIFRGLSDPVPGVRLSQVYEVQDLAVSALPPYYQDRVRSTIGVVSLSAARQTVNELAAAARSCRPTSQPTSAPSEQSGSPTAESGSPTAEPGSPTAEPSDSTPTIASPAPGDPSPSPTGGTEPGC